MTIEENQRIQRKVKERMEVYHNMSVVGKSPVWYEMSYEDAVKQQMKREARLEEAAKAKEIDMEDSDTSEKEAEAEDSDADDDFMCDLLSKVGMDDVEDQPVVNGTQSSSIPDDDFFDD